MFRPGKGYTPSAKQPPAPGGWPMTMGRVLLFAPCMSLNARSQAPPKSAPAPSQPALGAFVYVEGGKLYYEECGIGPEAFSSTTDRKSTRLNSSHDQISYAVFCLKKKKDDGTDASESRPPDDPGCRGSRPC